MNKQYASVALKAFIAVCVVATGIAALSPAPTVAAPSKPLEVTVVTEEFPPYNYTKDGEIVGRNTDIVKAVLARAGVKYTIKSLPWDEAYRLAQKEPNVIIYTILRMPARAGMFQWVRPLGKNNKSNLYALTSNTRQMPRSIKDARTLQIGCGHKTGAECVQLQEMQFNNLKVSSYADYLEHANQLLEKKVEFISADEANIKTLIQRGNLAEGDFRVVLELFSAQPYFALSNPTSPELTQKLQETYDALVAERRIKPHLN